MKNQNNSPWNVNTIFAIVLENTHSNQKNTLSVWPLQIISHCINMMKLAKTVEHANKTIKENHMFPKQL